MPFPADAVIFGGRFDPVADKSFRRLSNFQIGKFITGNGEYYTIEHFYQAEKYRKCAQYCREAGDVEAAGILDGIAQQIQTSSPRMPRVAKATAASNWENVPAAVQAKFLKEDRLALMKEGLVLKFNGKAIKSRKVAEGFKELLLSTGSRTIVERAPKDEFWGSGHDDQGHNHLGKLLMEVRDEVRRSV